MLLLLPVSTTSFSSQIKAPTFLQCPQQGKYQVVWNNRQAYDGRLRAVEEKDLPAEIEEINSPLPTPLDLNSEEDAALRAAAKELSVSYGESWCDDPKAWTQARIDYPILAPYEDDAQLRRTWILLTPSLLDVIVKTPVGPVFGVNILIWVLDSTGFSWCDTPLKDVFGSTCPPPV